MSEASAPIKSVGGKSRPRADQIAQSIGRHGACAGNRKTRSLTRVGRQALPVESDDLQAKGPRERAIFNIGSMSATLQRSPPLRVTAARSAHSRSVIDGLSAQERSCGRQRTAGMWRRADDQPRLLHRAVHGHHGTFERRGVEGHESGRDRPLTERGWSAARDPQPSFDPAPWMTAIQRVRSFAAAT
jgi:hypothetical protein